jgi:hypothetical protein
MCSLSQRFFADRVENKKMVIGSWRTKKCIQIDNDIGRKRSGAGGVKNGKPSIIVHDQGVL